MSTESDQRRQPQDGVICPKCLLSNSATAAFCADCGAPIGMVATVDPIQHIYAEGFAYRSAVDGPPKLIILLGMWLIFGSFACIGPCMILTRLPDQLPNLIFYNLLSLCSVIILCRTTRNYIIKSRAAKERNA